MHKSPATTLVAMVAAVILFNVSPATANRGFSIETPLAFSAISEGQISVEAEESVVAECSTTLGGEWGRGVIDIENPSESSEQSVMGTVRSMTAGACLFNRITFLGLAPGAVGWRAWLGGDPATNPERVTGKLAKLWGVNFLVSELLRACLYTGDIGVLIGLTYVRPFLVETGRITLLANEANIRLRETLAGICWRERIKILGSFTSRPIFLWLYVR